MDIPGIYNPGIFHSWNLFLSWNFLFLESYFTEFTCYHFAIMLTQKVREIDDFALAQSLHLLLHSRKKYVVTTYFYVAYIIA